MSFLSNIIRIVVWIIVINSVISTHFRGATVTWKAVDNSTDKILVTYRISWRRSYGSNYQCNSAAVSNRELLAGEGYLRSHVNGSGTETNIVRADYQCVDFSEKQDWMTGERKNYLVENITSKNFYIGFTGCCWVGSSSLNRYWRIWTKVNLNRRPDTGRINSSPFSSTQAVINVKHGCVHSIRIPVSDPDNDVVKCRFAKGFDECGSICHDLQGATIDQDKCIITYNANLNSGLYAVALQIEDFASKQSNTSLSSVALQFIVNVFKSSGNCSSMPYFSLTAPKQGFCHNLKVNETYTKKIVATSGSVNDDIVEFTTSSPAGLVKSSVSKFNGTNIDAKNVTWFYIDIEWTPKSSQKGANFFCFTAVSLSMQNSEERCITFHVGDTNPSVVSTVPVNNSIIPFQNNTFSMTFDQDVSKPTMEKFIYVRQENGPVIVNISTSLFQFQSNKLISFTIPRSKLQDGQAYRITADEGFVQGKYTCGLPAFPLESVWRYEKLNLTEKTWKQNLVCDKTKMTLYLNKEILPKYQKLEVTFENHVECKNTANQTHLIIETSHDTCGTRLKETARHIIYENTAVLAIGNDTTSGNSIITRKRKIRYELECKYDRQLNVSSTEWFKPVNASITTTERDFGEMTFALTMMKSSSYKQAYLPDDYPILAKLTDRLYIQLELEATNANLTLALQRCYATKTSNRNDPLKYNVILDRCPKDSTFLMHSYETKRYQFSIIAFQFSKESKGIYIHCEALVCKTSSADGRCNFGCAKTRQRRNAIENDMSKFYTVSSGYVKIGSDNASNESQGNKRGFWESSKVYMIIAGVAALALIGIVGYGVRRHFRNTKKEEKGTELKGIPNIAADFNE